MASAGTFVQETIRRRAVAKHTDAGVRARGAKSHQRVIIGSIDTTGPTILYGDGFTVAKNGAGDVTITFAAAYKETPILGLAIHRNPPIAIGATARSTSSVRILRGGGTGGSEDGVFDFTVSGVVL